MLRQQPLVHATVDQRGPIGQHGVNAAKDYNEVGGPVHTNHVTMFAKESAPGHKRVKVKPRAHRVP